jgi:hypothetical protein
MSLLTNTCTKVRRILRFVPESESPHALHDGGIP